MPMGGGAMGSPLPPAMARFLQAVPVGYRVCNLTPQYFTLAGWRNARSPRSPGHIDYLAVEEITGNLNYWNGSAYGPIFIRPRSQCITSLAREHVICWPPYNLRQIPTTASAGYLPLYFSSQQVGALGTNNYDWWEQTTSGGSPYSNVAGLGVEVNQRRFWALFLLL